ncbi:hypothetical protein [Rhodoglobus aureus]|uniref:Uncharacterized protein n=1 Tax=Rhodoglobus aureus TaxID=191497 RepID=A0ABN1VHR9_9MICO
MNDFPWGGIPIVLLLIAVGVTLVIARRSAFEAFLLLVEDWLPGYNPHSNLSPSPLYVGALGVVLIVTGIVHAVSLSLTAIEVFG